MDNELYVLSLIIPSGILLVIYGLLLFRVYRGTNYAFIKQIGWLMMVSNAATVVFGSVWNIFHTNHSVPVIAYVSMIVFV